MLAGQQDEHGPGGDGGAQSPLVLTEGFLPVAQQLAGDVFCGVVPGLGGGQTYVSLSASPGGSAGSNPR